MCLIGVLPENLVHQKFHEIFKLSFAAATRTAGTIN